MVCDLSGAVILSVFVQYSHIAWSTLYTIPVQAHIIVHVGLYMDKGEGSRQAV